MRSAFSARQRGGHRDRAARRLGGDLGRQLGVRGEAPGAVDDHPHRQPDLAVDDRGLQLTVAQLHHLGGDAVDAQVGVAGAGRAAALSAASASWWRGRARKSASTSRRLTATP